MHDCNGSTGPLDGPLDVDYEKTFDRAYLVNRLNYIDFMGGSVLSVFVHEKLHHERSLALLPQPCNGAELTCRRIGRIGNDLDTFHFSYLLVEDATTTLLVNAELLENQGDTLQLRLPETCHPVRKKASRSQINPNLSVEIFQKGIRFTAKLLDFSSEHFDIAVYFSPSQTHHWIDPCGSVYLVLKDHQEVCYSGSCTIEGRKTAEGGPVYRLRTENTPFHRYQPKKYRSKRVQLIPTPQVVFTHPLSMETFFCSALDISGMGFSFAVQGPAADLFTGLILCNLQLEMAGEVIAACKAQIVYRADIAEPNAYGSVRFGMAILDIDIDHHTRLQQMVQQASDPNAYVNGRVNQQALWSFFFDTGFLYPSKYHVLSEQKKGIRKTYDKLYIDQPSFARHFIYQKRGTILGHMAMIRFYAKAWLIHHHAARSTDEAGAGLRVLEQIGQFINESHAISAIQMEYVFFFYRPENRFPSLLFGKAAQFVGDPKKCSLDEFAYGHFGRPDDPATDLPPGWTLSPATSADKEIFKAFYSHESGGLMTSAFGFLGAEENFANLAQEYRRIGLQRERRLVALAFHGRLQAFFEINRSDVGLNMSDLTNCIRIFVIDRQETNRAVLSTALARLSENFTTRQVPVLIFPADAAEITPVDIQRHYILWILNLSHTDRYFAFVNRIIRFSRARNNNAGACAGPT